MKKILFISLLVLLLVTSCAETLRLESYTSFDDETTKSMEYQLFDGPLTYNWSLEQGDRLGVEITSEKGDLDLTIDDIYEGHDLTSMNFVLNINQTRVYDIMVHGNKHKGSFKLTKI